MASKLVDIVDRTTSIIIPSAFGLFFAIVLSLVAIVGHYYTTWKRLAHIPGPRPARFSILWLSTHAWRGNLFPTMIKVGETYGPLARIGPNLLLCSDPEEVKAISGTRSEYTKGPAYDAGRVTDGDPHLASERDPSKHKALKAKMGAAYSLDIQPAVDRQINSLINLIHRKYTAIPTFGPEAAHREHPVAKFMDFGQKMHFYALDCIGDFAFGEPFGFLERDVDVNQITHVNDLSLRMVTVAGLMPWLTNWRSRWPFKYLLPREGDKVGFGILFEFAQRLVDKRTAPDAESCDDMMQIFIRSGMTRHQLLQQVYIHILAGSDTTSNWARMTMLCLLTSPPVYSALQREIDEATLSGKLSKPIAKDAENRSLAYLYAVLRESLRLLPPSVSPSKLSPMDPQREDVTINRTVCGFPIPPGTQIGANVPGILRSRSIFGSDSECFRPERWLAGEDQSEQDRVSRMRTTLDIVFGAGKFQCMGKAIAWMEVRKLFVELLRRFDFAIVNNVKPLHLESLAIMVVHGFDVRVTCIRDVHRFPVPSGSSL